MTPTWPAELPDLLLRCPSIALDAERNLLSAVGILVGGVLYTCVAALGGPPGSITGNLFFSFGLAIWILCLMVAAGGVSRSVLRELDGQPPMGLAEMGTYLRGRGTRLVLVPLAFLGLAVTGVVAETFMAIVGAIPAIGPILYALSFTMSVAFSVVVTLILSVLVLGFPLYPAALGSRDAGVGEVIRELVGLVRRRLPRILVVEAALAAVCGALAFAIATLLRAALWITVTISEPAMGERFLRLVAGLPEPLIPLFESLAGPIPFYFSTGEGPAFYPVAGFLLGLSFLSLLSAAFAYPLTLLVTGGTWLYARLRALEGAADS